MGLLVKRAALDADILDAVVVHEDEEDIGTRA
jgi:hypothetical protein